MAPQRSDGDELLSPAANPHRDKQVRTRDERKRARDPDPRPTDETLASPSERDVDPDQPLARGAQVGRYVILDAVGSGAMGRVYAAYDPELDRKLALKILQSRRRSGDDQAIQDRLRREAQALARLSHPNVVTVHDVGSHRGRVFVAMEFVAGQTLRAWMDRGPHPIAEILRVFRAAGEGLAAAHRAGLIHRDFKPENVLLDGQLGVRVVDFGLARRADDLGASTDGRAPRSSPTLEDPEVFMSTGNRSLQVSLTRTGGIMGTPAYMAPEQHLGQRASARSDQFSFCVALWEALHGERPFPGRDMASLSLSVTEGRLRAIPTEGPYAQRPVPAHLQRAVVRGLASQPDDRYETMEQLLAALAEAPNRRRRVFAVVTSNVLAAALLFAAGFWYAERDEQPEASAPPPSCSSASELDGIWDDARRLTLKDRFDASEVPFADHARRSLERRLDGYAEQWRSASEATCEAEQLGGPSPSLELQRECLEQRRGELRAFTGALLDSDASEAGLRIEKSVAVAEALPSVPACLDPARLALVSPAGPNASAEQRERITELETRLSQARTIGRLGDPTAGLARAREVETEARTLASSRTLIRALLLVAELEISAREPDAAVAHLQEAYALAERSNEDWLRAEAALGLIGTLGFDLYRAAEARIWGTVADSLLERLGNPDDLRGRFWTHDGTTHFRESDFAGAQRSLEQALVHLERAYGIDAPELDPVLNHLGTVLRERGDYIGAVANHQRVLDRRREAYGAHHPEVAAAWSALGNDAYFQANYEQALGYFEESLRILADYYGEDSPAYSQRLNNYAATLERLGRLDEAEALHRRLLDSNTARFGSEDVRISTSLENLGNVLLAGSRFDEAAAMFERSLALRLAHYGADHAMTATTQANLGYARFRLGELAQARELYERALATWTEKLGPDHQDLALVHDNLGWLDLEEGKLAAAREHFERAIAITEAALGEDAVDLGYPLTGLALVALEAGELDEAILASERALSVRNGQWMPPGELGETQLALSRALMRRDGVGDRERARDLAIFAHEDIARGSDPKALAEARAWKQRFP